MAMRKHFGAGTANPAQEDCFSTSISDLMAGLLSIFILALVCYILNYNQKIDQITDNDTVRSNLLREVQAELRKNNIVVYIDEAQGTMWLSESVLFDKGQAMLKPVAKNMTVPRLAKVIVTTLGKAEYKNKVETVFIEGHTDDQPYHNKKFGNWELSVNRAINTWIVMQNTVPDIDKSLRNAKGEPLFSCSGYADTRPKVAGTSEEARRQNRRISFRITMTPPTKDNGASINKPPQKTELNNNVSKSQ